MYRAKVITVSTVITVRQVHMRINGKEVPTLAEAARIFGVTAKTVRQWIDSEIISKPPQIEHGARVIDYFPSEYMERAQRELKSYRDNKSKSRKSARPYEMSLFPKNG